MHAWHSPAISRRGILRAALFISVFAAECAAAVAGGNGNNNNGNGNGRSGANGNNGGNANGNNGLGNAQGNAGGAERGKSNAGVGGGGAKSTANSAGTGTPANVPTGSTGKVVHKTGFTEEIVGNLYVMRDPKGRLVVKRPVRATDLSRIRRLQARR